MTIQQIDELIEEGNSLKGIAQAYGEIASVKLKKIRAEVERNRQFFNEISSVYRIVKHQANLKKLTIFKKRGTISILITSNYRFYGNIDSEVIHFFIENMPKIPQTDRIVIGKTGQEYLKTIQYFHQYIPLEFKTDLPSSEELSKLLEVIKNYNQVLVFYPQLVTVLVQKPTLTDVTQSSAITTNTIEPSTINHQPPTIEYVIFEPELSTIMDFFDSQINILLLEQTFFEAELARTASRLIAMDQAQVEANRFILEQRSIRAHQQRRTDNMRLLENLSGRRRDLI